MATLHLSALYIYPVKSMAGIPLDAAQLDSFGLQHDRRWLLTDEHGVFMTQRKTPRMALVHVALTPTGLTLDAPGMPTLHVDVPDATTAPRTTVQVWNDRIDAVRANPNASAWCTSFLGQPCHLVHMPDDSVRPVKARHAKHGERVHFGDRFPLLIITEASLDDLNARLTAKGETAIPMNRFRPNVVIAGAAPYDEDRWTHIRIGGENGADIHLVKPCGRCVITTIDQQSARAGKEPLRTLATYRKQGYNVMFGQNALHHSPGGTLHVDDLITVLGEKKETRSPKALQP